jgi:L-threonylcarbamoyladenylate synthase
MRRPEFEAPPVDPAAIARAVEVLKRGGLVALPTETVYGLAADATNESAVRAIFAAKGRPADHPVIVHVQNESAIELWASAVPPAAHALAQAFWPGPLTLVLKRSARISDLVTGGQDTVGLRAPAHPWTQAVLRGLGRPLAAPSANRFGRVSPTTAGHVRADLGEKPDGAVDLILDGGPCPVGIESTIVDLTGARPRLLRHGFIARSELERVLGVAVDAADPTAPRVSGSLERHYAPATPLEVVPAEALAGWLRTRPRLRLAVLAPPALIKAWPSVQRPQCARAAASDADDYARALYADLRRLDAAGADRIVVVAPPAGERWLAIHDRLRRAQAGSGPLDAGA